MVLVTVFQDVSDLVYSGNSLCGVGVVVVW